MISSSHARDVRASSMASGEMFDWYRRSREAPM